MKIQILITLLLGFVLFAPVTAAALSTNTSLTGEAALEVVSDGKTVISQWKNQIQEIKADGLSLGILFSVIILVITSIITLGVITVMLLKVIQFFTSDTIDIKLKKVEDWITDNLIKLPITILDKLKGVVKKKP